jgi:hypothetical protein
LFDLNSNGKKHKKRLKRHARYKKKFNFKTSFDLTDLSPEPILNLKDNTLYIGAPKHHAETKNNSHMVNGFMETKKHFRIFATSVSLLNANNFRLQLNQKLVIFHLSDGRFMQKYSCR